MTVTYSADVHNSSIVSLYRAIFRWKGSLWKSVYRELFLWCVVYTILAVSYRFWMNTQQQELFEDISALCYKYSNFIPLTFMLGFFVSKVMERWQKQFENMGWCDNYSLYIVSYIPGSDKRSRMMRRTIFRYLELLQVMVFRDISVKIRERFPTWDAVISEGFITFEELKILESIKSPSKYWVPVQWAMGVVVQARKEGRVSGTHFGVQDLFKRILDFRRNKFTLILFDWVPLPLVYTQVVFLTVRIYFVIALVGRQYLISDRYAELRGPVDAYVPFFTIVQFVFCNGWLRVAESLLNPFGKDDDDFECNWAIDRNTKASLDIIDGTDPSDIPPFVKDKFWGQKVPMAIYSAETIDAQVNPQVGSAIVNSKESSKPVVMVPRKTLTEDEILQQRRGSWFGKVMGRPPHQLSQLEIADMIEEETERSESAQTAEPTPSRKESEARHRPASNCV